MKERLSLKGIFLFFLPLIFMTELIQVSHSITNAFLARLSSPKETLAAFSIAFAFNLMTGGIIMAATQTGISFITDRQALLRVLRFLSITALVPFGIVELLSLTWLGNIVFGQWVGVTAEVVEQAKLSSAIMGLWIFPVLIRNICYAMVMIQRKTLLITYATLIRLTSLIGFLVIYSFWFNGAVVGAMATVSGMTVEALYMVLAARSYFSGLKTSVVRQASYLEYWKFSWPLMITQMSENGVVFILNLFLGRLSQPELAIAAFGVVYGLVRVILAPLRNLVNTAQTLIQKQEDLRIMFQFTLGLLSFYTGLIFLMFFTPLRHWILGYVMGLTAELNHYCIPAVEMTFLIAVFWGTAALLRGILSAMRRTGAIAFTAFVRLLVVTGIGSIAFLRADFNGAVLGVFAIAGAFAAETIVLGWRLHCQARQFEPLFPTAS